MNTLRRQFRQPMQQWLLCLLLGAWLAAQSLGLVHRELHGSALDAITIGAQASTVQVAVAGEPSAAKSSGLFAGHAKSSDCRLYDHAGAADLLLCLPALAVAAVFVPLPLGWLPVTVAGRTELSFQARGPPSLR
jgi:hypothetical protein